MKKQVSRQQVGKWRTFIGAASARPHPAHPPPPHILLLSHDTPHQRPTTHRTTSRRQPASDRVTADHLAPAIAGARPKQLGSSSYAHTPMSTSSTNSAESPAVSGLDYDDTALTLALPGSSADDRKRAHHDEHDKPPSPKYAAFSYYLPRLSHVARRAGHVCIVLCLVDGF